MARLVAAVLACALTLSGPGSWTAARAQNKLPALGDTDSADFSVGTERKIGDEIMREIRAIPTTSTTRFCSNTCSRLAAARRRVALARQHHRGPRSALRLGAVPGARPSVNAFALPGGYIGVHLGLIAITATRDELASVLAHEMSHVTQRHIARSITSSKRSLVSLAALVLGMLAASRSNSPDAINAVIAGRQAGAIQGQLNFSRDMEREADRVGFRHDRGRLRAGRHGRDVREDGQVLAAQRQRRLPLPAQPPADDRAHRRGAFARRHAAGPAR